MRRVSALLHDSPHLHTDNGVPNKPLLLKIKQSVLRSAPAGTGICRSGAHVFCFASRPPDILFLPISRILGSLPHGGSPKSLQCSDAICFLHRFLSFVIALLNDCISRKPENAAETSKWFPAADREPAPSVRAHLVCVRLAR